MPASTFRPTNPTSLMAKMAQKVMRLYQMMQTKQRNMKSYNQSARPLVYFDGCCGFCSGFVNFIVKTSKARQTINFMPYQAVTSTAPEELLLIDSTSIHEAGKAAVKVLFYAGGIFRFFGMLLQIVPEKLLNTLYYSFARNRYRWFGQTTCTVG